MEDNGKSSLNKFVFFTSASIILLFVVISGVFTEQMATAMSAVKSFIGAKFGWFYMLAVGLFLVFVLYLFFSPFGKIRLGKETDEPDYSYPTWFAMLFSAGMGIGLLFYGVAEPIYHFAAPPMSEAETIAAAREAMRVTMFHWGLHAWAIYIVVGLSLAYFHYRHNLPLTIRYTLYPILGEKTHGKIGQIVEIFAIFGTLFGVATSLGLGVAQINSGLDYLFGFANNTTNQIILICVITAAATASVVTGLDKGIKRLSEANLGLALILLLFVFFAGPTILILSSIVQNGGNYLQNVVGDTFNTMVLDEDANSWRQAWTMFYWGWWISWSPFVGMFIARVSKGRSIREFIGGVLLVPTVLSLIWFTVFGNTAINLEMQGGGMIDAVNNNMSTAIFVMLEKLPLGMITSTIATLLVATFFVTSSDSGSLVIDILSSDGDPDPPLATRIFWALTEGAVAIALIFAGGDEALNALQAAAVATGLPFTVIMLFMCYALWKGLRAEAYRLNIIDRPRAQRREIELAGGEDGVETVSSQWRDRLAGLLGKKKQRLDDENLVKAREQLKRFVAELATPALEEIGRELKQHGREVSLETHDYQVALYVYNEGDEEFFYAIRGRAYHPLSFAYPEFGSKNSRVQPRGQVILRSGVESTYNIEEYTHEGIIANFMHEYSKWMGW